MRKTRAGAALFLSILAVAAGCGQTGPASPSPHTQGRPHAQASGTAPSAAAQPASGHPLPKVTLRLDVPANGSMAPFFVALSKGYYRKAGLDMTAIGDGHGSVITAEDIAAGHDTFGYASADSVASVISKGGKVKVVAVYYQQNPAVIMFKANAPIHKPTDLYGKTVADKAGATSAQMLQAFMAATHLDAKRIKVVSLAINAQAAALARGNVDALSVFAYGFLPQMTKLGVKVRMFKLSQYGVGDLAGGTVVSEALISKHPNRVRAYLKATNEGFAFALAHPGQAVSIMRHYRPNLNQTVGVEQLKLALQLLHTPASAKDPVGYMRRSDWVATLKTAHRFEGLKKVLPLSSYYTNAYLPSS